MIRRLVQKLRQRQARKRLDQIVRQARDSYECEQYRRRRAAALKARAGA